MVLRSKLKTKKGQIYYICPFFISLFSLCAYPAYAQDKSAVDLPGELKERFDAYYLCLTENSFSSCRNKLFSDIKEVSGVSVIPEAALTDILQNLEQDINRIIQPLNCKLLFFVIPDSEVINCWLAKSVKEEKEERIILGRRICADITYMDNLIIRDYLYFSTQGQEMLDAGSKYSSIYFNLEALRKRALRICDFFQSREKESFSKRYAPSELDRLRKHIQHKAWGVMYEEALQKNKDLEKARIHFIEKALKEIRENSLVHELAHIYVQDNPKLKLNISQEEEFAFLYELAYGKMPFETLDTIIGIQAKGLKNIYLNTTQNILTGFLDYIQKQKSSASPEFKKIPVTGSHWQKQIQYLYLLQDRQVRKISSLLLNNFLNTYRER